MIIWSLFSGSGLDALPFAEKGHTVKCFNYDDADHGDYASHGARIEHSRIEYINAYIDADFARKSIVGHCGRVDMILALPSCTDFAVSGSRHFARRREADPDFQNEAAATARIAADIAESLNVPYMIENPVKRIGYYNPHQQRRNKHAKLQQIT